MPSLDAAPRSLRSWFIVHFVADLLFAVPLFFAPDLLLGALGWPTVDAALARVVAAALFGIGIQSFLGRDEPLTTFRAMLTLKVIWSATATVGIAASVLTGRAPPSAWLFVAIFGGFCGLWTYWRARLSRAVSPAAT